MHDDVDVPSHSKRHSSSSSVSSAFPLASPVYLSHSSRSITPPKKSLGLFNKLSKRHKSSESYDWVCKGEDLDTNFHWPDEGLYTKNDAIPEHLSRRLSQATVPDLYRCSVISDSDASSIFTPTSSRPASTSPLASLECLPAVITDATDKLFSEFMSLPSMQSHQLPKPRPQPLDLSKATTPQKAEVAAPQRTSSLVQLDEEEYPTIEIKPLRVKRQSVHLYSPEDLTASEQRRKRDEALAIESLNAFLGSPVSPIRSTQSSLPSRSAPLQPLAIRQGSVDYSLRALPSVPKPLPNKPVTNSLAERRRSSCGPRPASMFIAGPQPEKSNLKSSSRRQSQAPLYGYI